VSVVTADRQIVLVVDDSDDMRALLTMALRGAGYAVAQAAGGHEALGYLRSEVAPALIVLDLRMPVMDGWGFLAARAEYEDLSDIPVLIYSAEGDIDQTRMLPPLAGFISKTMPITQVVAEVHRICTARPTSLAL